MRGAPNSRWGLGRWDSGRNSACGRNNHRRHKHRRQTSHCFRLIGLSYNIREEDKIKKLSYATEPKSEHKDETVSNLA